MNARKLLGTLGAIAVGGFLTAQANATIFGDTLIDDAVNVYEDQSREAIFDVNRNDSFDEGDVVWAMLRIDERIEPTPSANIDPPNDLYVLAAFEVTDLTSSSAGANDFYEVTYGPVTSAAAIAAGLDFDSLVGGTPALDNPGDAIAAIYEDVGTNLITTFPGDVDGNGQTDFMDMVAEIRGSGTLDAIAGFGTGDPDDFLFQTALVASASPIDPFEPGEIADLGAITSSTFFQSNFIGGFSMLLDLVDGWEFQELVNIVGGPGGSTFHDLGLLNGTNSGARGLQYTGVDPNGGLEPGDVVAGNPFFFSYDPGGGANPILAYGIANNADAAVAPNALNAIPEPASLGLLGMAGLGLLIRRRNA